MAVTAIPDGARRLADGLIIEACIVARLLGVRLLRVEATVVVSPAEMLSDARDSAGSRPIGARLAAAQRQIDEGATRLQASRAPSGARRP